MDGVMVSCGVVRFTGEKNADSCANMLVMKEFVQAYK